MPDWLTIVIAVTGLVGTIFGVLGISGYIGERAKHKAELRNRQDDRTADELEALRHKRNEDSIRSVFKSEMKPITDKLSNIEGEIIEIKHDLADNTIGTVTMLRDRMKAILDECRDAGYATTGTKANWRELYNTYASLGGNHFREYVDAWKQELEDLPVIPPTNTTRSRRQQRAVVDIFTTKLPIDGVELPKVDASQKEPVTVGKGGNGKKGK